MEAPEPSGVWGLPSYRLGGRTHLDERVKDAKPRPGAFGAYNLPNYNVECKYGLVLF